GPGSTRRRPPWWSCPRRGATRSRQQPGDRRGIGARGNEEIRTEPLVGLFDLGAEPEVERDARLRLAPRRTREQPAPARAAVAVALPVAAPVAAVAAVAARRAVALPAAALRLELLQGVIDAAHDPSCPGQ